MNAPRFIKVIKSGTRYYSSFIDKRQSIYGFTSDTELDKCRRFLVQYKTIHNAYPPADCARFIKQTIPDLAELHVSTEETELLQRSCIMYNVGLVHVHKFDYMLSPEHMTVDIKAEDIIPIIEYDDYIDLLNYALILGDEGTTM